MTSIYRWIQSWHYLADDN